jgi:hypothetical protein
VALLLLLQMLLPQLVAMALCSPPGDLYRQTCLHQVLQVKQEL